MVANIIITSHLQHCFFDYEDHLREDLQAQVLRRFLTLGIGLKEKVEKLVKIGQPGCLENWEEGRGGDRGDITNIRETAYGEAERGREEGGN